MTATPAGVDPELLRAAVANGRIHWHHHALERLFERQISRAEVLDAMTRGEIIEHYAEREPYPSCLILHIDDEPLHVVAAVDHEATTCHIVTVYRPDLEHFEADFKTRK